jgi:large subunit ribosomal protein L25
VAENLLKIEVREGVGKGVARKLRAAGRIPGVIYGRAVGPQPITLDPAALRRSLAKSEAGLNTLFSLDVAGGGALHGKPVLVRDLQRDPVRGGYLHADLLAVDLLQRIEVRVPIHITGKAKGVEFGGILDHALREIELECLPTAIPREIQVDVSSLEVGDSLHVRDLPLPEGVELRSTPICRWSCCRRSRRRRAAPASKAQRPRQPKRAKPGRVLGRRRRVKLVVGLDSPGPRYAGTRTASASG